MEQQEASSLYEEWIAKDFPNLHIDLSVCVEESHQLFLRRGYEWLGVGVMFGKIDFEVEVSKKVELAKRMLVDTVRGFSEGKTSQYLTKQTVVMEQPLGPSDFII